MTFNIYFYGTSTPPTITVETTSKKPNGDFIVSYTNVREATSNTLLFDPIPSLYLRSSRFNNKNELRILLSNGIGARCENNCELALRTQNIPTLTNIDTSQKS